MTFDDLARIDWESIDTTAACASMLGALFGLAAGAKSPEQRRAVADALDAFADNASSDDLDALSRLDGSARRAARALRLANVSDSVAELQAATADFRGIEKDLGAASAGLKKEAATLRAEKIRTALASLNETILSLDALAMVVAAGSDKDVELAISHALDSVRTLQGLLGKPG